MLILAAGCLSLLTQNPVGYWRGDDAPPTTALDSSGNGRNGSYNGATSYNTTLPPGLFQNVSAFSLDGVNDEVSIPHNAAFNLTGDMTIAFWMRKTNDPSDWVRVIGKGATAVRTFGIWEEPGAGARLYFQQYNGSNTALINLYSTGTVQQNVWTHVALTVAGNTATYYLNGAPSGSGTRSGTPGTDGEPVRIGYAGYHTYFSGQIDEVRLFNDDLTEAQIRVLAGLDPYPPPQNLRDTALSPGSATLAWDAAPGATRYGIKRSVDGGPFVPVATNVTATSYTDSNLTWGETYTYVVYAVGPVDSADSAPHAVMIPFPAPRTEDHEEGLFGDNCACGATSRGASIGWALLALLPLLLRRR